VTGLKKMFVCGVWMPLLTVLLAFPLSTVAYASQFWKESKNSAHFYLWSRKRDRLSDTNNDGLLDNQDKFQANLQHTTVNTAFDFESGYAYDFVGFDLGLYLAADLQNTAFYGHELAFFAGDGTLWGADFSQKDKSAISFYKAALKFKRQGGWGQLGYFQPSGPGILGVNWSLLPGSYRGAEMGFRQENLSMAASYVTQYKAPWFTKTYDFRRNDGETVINHVYSLGIKYDLNPSVSAELAYGQSSKHLNNSHIKIKYKRNQQYLSYQLYRVGDSDDSGGINDNFNGTGLQHYIAAHWQLGGYRFRGEALLTKAPQTLGARHLGYFVYRPSSQFGGSNGAYEPWWNARSDWDHDEERAVFFSISRALFQSDDRELTAGLSYAYGWNGQSVHTQQELKEEAYNADVTYTTRFKKSKIHINLHYTHYDNKTTLPSYSSGGFANAFQDERDIKLIIGLHHTFY